MSKGNYVGHIDGDDILLKDAVELCVDIFQKNPQIKMIYSNFEHVDKDNKKRLGIHRNKSFSKGFSKSPPVWSTFGIYNRKAALKVSGFNKKMVTCEDGELVLKLAEKYDLYHLDKVLYRRRTHENNISGVYLANDCKLCKFTQKKCPYFKRFNKNLRKLEH